MCVFLAIFGKKCALTAIVLTLVVSIFPAQAKTDLTLRLPGLGLLQASLVTVETFDRQSAWERYFNQDGAELGVENGVYRAYTMSPGYVWGLNQQQQSDVILEVEATPMTPNFENGYGVMCRADSSGDGYYFMMNPNGNFSIQVGDSTGIRPLVEWKRSKAIKADIDRNTIRAVCVGDYLAMYINDTFVAEVSDDTYSSGYIGLSVAASENSDVDAAFDNLAIYTVASMP
jgi:hypothetical protein